MAEPTTEFDIDIYADGIIAHRDGTKVYENPYRGIDTYQYLSWHKGWNDREQYMRNKESKA